MLISTNVNFYKLYFLSRVYKLQKSTKIDNSIFTFTKELCLDELSTLTSIHHDDFKASQSYFLIIFLAYILLDTEIRLKISLIWGKIMKMLLPFKKLVGVLTTLSSRQITIKLHSSDIKLIIILDIIQ